MLDLKTLIAKSATDAELNRVRDAMRRNEKNKAPEAYRATFEKLSNKWGLTFNDDRIVVPNELRKKTNGNTTFRTCRVHKDDTGSQNFLVAQHAERNRRENKKLCGLHGFW